MKEKPVEYRRGDGKRENRKEYGGGYIGKHNGQVSDSYNEQVSYPTDLWAFNSKWGECNALNRIHPTQKPVKLIEELILTYTNEGETVLDNCAGSGTTAIACINTNRNYILIEKEKEYIDIINKRIAEHEQQLALC